MTPDEVLAVFPGSEADPKLKVELSAPPSRFGTLSFVIQPSEYQSKEQFADTSNITFALLDARVSNFHIGYNGPRYSHVDEFVAKIVSGTNLPTADQWEPYVGLDTQLKILKCADFEVRVFAGGGAGIPNYVEVQDLEADKKLKELRRKARAQASPTPGQ